MAKTIKITPSKEQKAILAKKERHPL
jgi:hypothetical protein